MRLLSLKSKIGRSFGRHRHIFAAPVILLLIVFSTQAAAQTPMAPDKPTVVLQMCGGISSLDHAPKVNLIVLGAINSVSFWDDRNGMILRGVSWKTDNDEDIVYVEFSPDGAYVAVLTRSRNSSDRLRIIDVRAGEVTVTSDLGFNLGLILDKKGLFSHDGRLLAIPSMDSKLGLWDMQQNKIVRFLDPATIIPANNGWVNSCSFSPAGSLLAMANTRCPTVTVWDRVTGKIVRQIECGAQPLQVAFDRTGNSLSVLHCSGEKKPVAHAVSRWDLRSGGKIATAQIPEMGDDWHQNLMVDAFFSKDASRLLFGKDYRLLPADANPYNLYLCDALTGRLLKTFNLPNAADAVTLTADNKTIVYNVVNQPILVLLNADSKKVGWRAADDVFDQVRVKTSPNRRWLAAVGRKILWDDLTVYLWNLGTGTLDRYLKGGLIDFSKEDHLWFREPWDKDARGHKVRCWDFIADRDLFQLQGVGGEAMPALSPDNRLLAFKPDVRIMLWDIRENQRLAPPPPRPGDKYDVSSEAFFGIDGNVKHLVFSPDGGWLAAYSDRGVGVSRTAFAGKISFHAGFMVTGWSRDQSCNKDIRPVFSPDSRYLATAEPYEDKIRIYDLNAVPPKDEGPSLSYLKKFSHEFNDSAHYLDFSPDGGFLASTDGRSVTVRDLSRANAPIAWKSLLGGGIDLHYFNEGRLLAVAGTGVHIWDAKSGALLCSLYSFDNDMGNEWLVLTPDGLFDGSPGGLKRIRWRFKSLFDIYPIEVFFREFFYPGLLAEIVAGRVPRAPRLISSIDRRQPVVKLKPVIPLPAANAGVGSRRVAIRIEVAEASADAEHPAGSGVQDVRLFRNGSLVKVWKNNVLPKTGGKAILEAAIPIVAGDNVLTAYAFNRDNVKSPDATLLVRGGVNLKRPGKAYILAMGVNEYANPAFKLNFAVADATAIAAELKNRQSSLGSLAGVVTASLFDREATKANLMEALKRLAGKSGGAMAATIPKELQKLKALEPEDSLFIYFAGHGIAANNHFYLIPHDLGYGESRDKLDQKGLRTILDHSVSDLELSEWLEGIDAGMITLIIDACNSGQVLEADEKRRGPMNSKGLAQLAYEKGMYVLTASQGYQAALEASQLGHGVLTFALVEEGLKTMNADRAPVDRQVFLREWLDYASLRVPELQLMVMKDARQQGREVAFIDGERDVQRIADRSLQHPRVFYRREPESRPLLIKKEGM